MKKQTKLVASLFVAGALALSTPTVAQAYPAPTPDAPVVSGDVVAGGSVTVLFSGFESGAPVTVELTGESALSATIGSVVKTAVETHSTTTTARADGTVMPTISLPANATGTYTVTATSGAVVQTATFTIGGTSDSELAVTGSEASDLTGLWVGGVTLILAGGAVVTAAAIRRRYRKAD